MNIFFRTIFFLTVFLSLINNQYLPIFAQNNLPQIIIDKTDEVLPPNRSETFFVYFNYGDPGVTYEVKDLQAQISAGGRLEIDREKIYDIYENDQTKQVKCEPGSLPGKKINPDLVKNNVLNYGLGSVGNTEGGAESADLKPRQVGCLKIGLKVKNEGENLSQIEYKIKDLNSKTAFYKKIDEQPEKKILFFVGEKSTCKNGQEWALGACREVCGENMYRDLSGNCLVKNIICPQEEEVFNEKCVPKCKENESRSSFGECKPIEEPVSEQAGKVLEYLLIFGFGAIILNLLWSQIAKILKKKRG